MVMQTSCFCFTLFWIANVKLDVTKNMFTLIHGLVKKRAVCYTAIYLTGRLIRIVNPRTIWVETLVVIIRLVE